MSLGALLWIVCAFALVWTPATATSSSCEPPYCQGGAPFRVTVPYRGGSGTEEMPPLPPPPAPDSALSLLAGGRLWVTEDPAILDPRLSVEASGDVVLRGGQLEAPVRFSTYTNYEAFLYRFEFLVFRGNDTDLADPVHTMAGPVESLRQPLTWDATTRFDIPPRPGDQFLYVLRVYDREGHFDETHPKVLRFVDSVQAARNDLTEPFSTLARFRAEPDRVEVFGQTDLVHQNIPLKGSRVRVHGDGIVGVNTLKIDDQNVPIDEEGRFVREFMLPVGSHTLPVEVVDNAQRTFQRGLDVEVSGRYFFLVGLADLTFGQNDLSGNVESISVSGSDHFDGDIFVDGRLALYLKGKIKGKYLLTTQFDTTEDELSDLFTDFHRKDPRTLFRRLDPDRFYPVYGDDSTTVSDIDTQGRMYVRLDWDKSELLWGNYDSNLTGTEFGEYDRSLYGAKLHYRSTDTNRYGDPARELSLFGSEPQSVLAHDEFLGTGGSLYFLRHTEIVQGSEKAAVEVRDPDTGRTIEKITLERGRNYEIDEIQGRIILTRPLLQVADQVAPSIIKDAPLDGNQAFLIVDYEYVPDDFNPDQLTAGARGKTWVGDRMGLGATFIQEQRRDGRDYSLAGTDVTLRAGRGTYIKMEVAQSRATQSDANTFSDDGGLTFIRPPGLVFGTPGSDREGDAVSVETRVNLGEVTEGALRGAAAGWWKRRDEGFSTAGTDGETWTEQYGGELLWETSDALRLSARGAHVDRDDGRDQTEASGQVDWRFAPSWTLSGELLGTRSEFDDRDDETAVLSGLRIGWDMTDQTLLYTGGQLTLARNHHYEKNNFLTLGARSRFSEQLYLRAEGSAGDRGQSLLVGADYDVRPGHQVYGSYTYSTDRTDGQVGQTSAATFGQRARLSNQLQVFTENQFTHGDRQSGIAHAYGLDFRPARHWVFGLSAQSAELDDSLRGNIDRHAVSLSGGFRDDRTQWFSKIEFRLDRGDVDRLQWVTTNRVAHRLSDSVRMLVQGNYSQTRERESHRAIARFIETALGAAYRPIWNDRLNVLGKYTFLYDLPSIGQDFGGTDERSHVISLQALYQLARRWQLGSKLAWKLAELRAARAEGRWFESETVLVVGNVRYHFLRNWDAFAEYRWLSLIDTDEDRHGALLGIYRHLGDTLKIGAGYNFTHFNDDLVHLDFDNHGWFVNLVGKF